MKRNLRYYIVFLLAITLSLNVQAQEEEKPPRSEKKAKKWYEDLGYSEAINAYGGKAGTGSYDLEDMIKIANSYRKNNDYYNAQMWYAQVVEKSDDPIYKLYLAQALQANGKYEAAYPLFQIYDIEAQKGLAPGEEGDRRGAMGMQACKAIENFRNATDVTVWNVVDLNTEKLDFSPSYYKNGLVFVSTRGTGSNTTSRKDTWINDNFMELFFADKKDESSFNTPEIFSKEINTKYHEGPMTFTENGDVMFFTRNNYNDGKRRKDEQDVTLLKIYSAQEEDGDWSDVTELPFNSDLFHSCHPTLSADGQRLYFASDRPGGYGGLDIYVSSRMGGTWSEPVNLGSSVNTKGNEAFPFMHESGTLYYASNGLPGLGGLDIFTTNPTWKNEAVSCTKPENLGKPFNSKKDDFGFIMDDTGRAGYFTSSRKGGKGQDDIYSWKSSDNPVEEPEMITSVLSVCDEETGERITGARVVAFDSEGKEGMTKVDEDYVLGLKPTTQNGDYVLSIKKAGSGTSEAMVYTTDDSGSFTFKRNRNIDYSFRVVKSGYEEKYYELKNDECIPLRKRNCTQLIGKVNNAVYKGKVIPNASVSLMNKCTGEVEEFITGPDGAYDFCLECDCEYELIGSKTNFSTDKEGVSMKNVDCSKTVEQDLNLTFGLFEELVATTPVPNSNTPNNPMIGRSIVLEKLYYDFDQFYIRADAARELDQVVDLLREFPSMEIELSSHTDARGTDKYNEELSQNRADAAVQYIISKGINASRLQARGYGEKYPRNRCRDKVECSEEEHQYNRRTEIRITRFARYNDVKVDYIDNNPETIDKADPNRKWIWD